MKHISIRTSALGHPQRSASSAEGYDSLVLGVLVTAKLLRHRPIHIGLQHVGH
jgi:hypothetical protein